MQLMYSTAPVDWSLASFGEIQVYWSIETHLSEKIEKKEKFLFSLFNLTLDIE